MKSKKLLTALFILFAQFAVGQELTVPQIDPEESHVQVDLSDHFDFSYEYYSWEKEFDKSLYAGDIQTSKDALLLLNRSVLFLGKDENKKFLHKLFWVKNEAAIAKINRIRISESKSGNQKVIARTITKEGKVVELDQSQFKEVETDDKYGSKYKMYSIPGVEAGSFVEIIFKYTYPKWSNDYRFVANDQFDIERCELIIQSDHLISVKHKGYNGFDLVAEKKELGYNLYKYRVKGKVSVKEEKYSHQYESLPRVDVVRKSYDWEDLARMINYQLFPKPITGAGAGYSNILKKAGVNKQLSDREKVIAIENYVKNTVSATGKSDKKYSDPRVVARDKVANDKGLIRLYANLLVKAKVEFDLYIATDNDYIDLDEGFPSFLGMDPMVFYLPDLNAYLLPSNSYYRVGEIPNFMAGRKGLCITKERYKLGRIKSFPSDKKEYNYVSTVARMKWVEGNEAEVDFQKICYGNQAIRMRGVMNYRKEEEKEEYIHDVVLSKMENSTVKEYSLKNEAMELNAFSKDTLIISSKISSEDLITTVPDGIILEIPKLIGIQGSVYAQEERRTDIYVYRSVIYHHELYFDIPEGYRLVDASPFRFYRSCAEGMSNVFAEFRSTAKLDGDQLIIVVDEFYEKGIYDKRYYDDFQKVINAAYEFYISKTKLEKVTN